MNINDTFPPRNLPDNAVKWGREMENRIHLLQRQIKAAEEELKNGNRTTAAVTSELARQLDKLEGFLQELEDLLAELEALYRSIPKTYQTSNRTTGFGSSIEWTSVCSITVSFPEGANHVEITAFGSGALHYGGSQTLATAQGRMVIRGGSGPYVSGDEFYTVSGWSAILTPQNTRSLDGTQDFQVEFQMRVEDSASFPPDPDNYANLTVLASFTGV